MVAAPDTLSPSLLAPTPPPPSPPAPTPSARQHPSPSPPRDTAVTRHAESEFATVSVSVSVSPPASSLLLRRRTASPSRVAMSAYEDPPFPFEAWVSPVTEEVGSVATHSVSSPSPLPPKSTVSSLVTRSRAKGLSKARLKRVSSKSAWGLLAWGSGPVWLPARQGDRNGAAMPAAPLLNDDGQAQTTGGSRQADQLPGRPARNDGDAIRCGAACGCRCSSATAAATYTTVPAVICAAGADASAVADVAAAEEVGRSQ